MMSKLTRKVSKFARNHKIHLNKLPILYSNFIRMSEPRIRTQMILWISLLERFPHRKMGSCVLKASVDRVSVDTLDRYVDRQSADMSTEYRPIRRPTCRPSIGRHVLRVNRPSVDTIGRYVGRHSADISADMSAGVSVDCRWCISRLSVVSEYC